ncbi:unnamed protein product [Hermetia illucens]|uniref:Uncharacterized protein n=1 Tax=Hermetia illucens TaxID=343691 RepID=A0A7R8Z516_HERIL|nr:unnamed protein product [Hermetia illucens]
MANFCKVLSNQQSKKSPETQFSFQELWNLTEKWFDELRILEDIFQRQTFKVIEHGLKLNSIQDSVMSAARMIANAKDKLREIDKEIATSSFNLDILELFTNSLENRAPELNPNSVDCQRFTIYQTLVTLVYLVDNNQEAMDDFFEEYNVYKESYRKNIENGITGLEHMQRTIEESFNLQLQSKAKKSQNDFC